MAISNINLTMNASSYGAYEQRLTSATKAELDRLGIPYDPNSTTESMGKRLIAEFKSKKANNEQAQNSFTKNNKNQTSDLYEKALKLAQKLGIEPDEGLEFKSLLTLIEQKLEAKVSAAQNNEALLKQLEGYSQELASIQAQSAGANYDTTNKALQMSLEMLSLYNKNYLNR